MENLFTNTPMIKIIYEYNNETKKVYSKLEYFSLTGSIKDKVAYYILTKAFKDGSYEAGMPIVIVSSGNTAISFAALGNYFKSPVYAFIPSWVSKERKELLKFYGVKIKQYSQKQGGLARCNKEADILAEKINAFNPNQFSNINNILAHKKYTVKEILKKLKKVDTFVSGIGTGGTIMASAEVFKKKFNAKIISVVAKSNSKTHKIDGITDGIIPEILDNSLVDKEETILDADAINMSIKFCEELGLGIGISSAANFLGSVINNNGTTVTIFPDDNKKYLSILKDKCKRKQDYISNKINLITYEVI